MLIKIWKRSW